MSPRRVSAESVDPDFYRAVGRAIELSRRYQDLSRRQLADAAGISYSYLSEIETGKKGPSAEALLAIARALTVSPSELLGEAEDWMALSRTPVEGLRASDAATPPEERGRSVFRNARWLDTVRRPERGPILEPSSLAMPRVRMTRTAPRRNASDLARAEQLLEEAKALSPEAREELINRLLGLRP